MEVRRTACKRRRRVLLETGTSGSLKEERRERENVQREPICRHGTTALWRDGTCSREEDSRRSGNLAKWERTGRRGGRAERDDAASEDGSASVLKSSARFLQRIVASVGEGSGGGRWFRWSREGKD